MIHLIRKTALALVANAPQLGLLPDVSCRDFENLQEHRRIWAQQRRKAKETNHGK